MGIDEQAEAVFARPAHHLVQVVQVLQVVESWPGMLDRLPGDQQAQESESPGPKPRQVLVGFCQRKGASHERDVAVVKKALAHVRRTMGPKGHLAAAPQVDPPQDQRPPLCILEP